MRWRGQKCQVFAFAPERNARVTMPTTSPPSTPQEQAAAARQFNIEVFTLLAVGILVTALRTYTRLVSVGWKKIQADDFLALFAIVSLNW